MRRLKTTKLEVDLETVLRRTVMWLIEGLIVWSGVGLLFGHPASPAQVVGGMLLLFAVYLLMPSKDDE